MGISLVAYSLTTTIVRIVDLIFDPLLGWTRIARMAAGAVSGPGTWSACRSPCCALHAAGTNEGAGVFYLGLWYLILWIGLSITTLAHASWGARPGGELSQRSRIYGWMTAPALLGSVGLLLLPLLTDHKIVLGKLESFHAISLIIVIGSPIGFP